MTHKPPPLLSPLEARVLAVLVEKEHTVPDTYPLTLNALVAGCNQKTARDPVMSVTDAQAQLAIDPLMRQSLVIESSGGRVMRYAQNVRRVLGVPSESVALLATLILRGPQTAAELRLNCERLQRFSDLSAVMGFLEELANWPAGPLVVQLPRAPGSRENRWAHLLCGAAQVPEPSARALPDSGGDVVLGEIETLKLTVARLEDELSSLRETVARLCTELGVQ